MDGCISVVHVVRVGFEMCVTCVMERIAVQYSIVPYRRIMESDTRYLPARYLVGWLVSLDGLPGWWVGACLLHGRLP